MRSTCAWFDGDAVTVLDRQHNRYAVLDTPDNIDEMLDYVVETFDVVFPLADMLHSDVYESLTAGAAYTSYLGIHQEGVAVDIGHHAARSPHRDRAGMRELGLETRVEHLVHDLLNLESKAGRAREELAHASQDSVDPGLHDGALRRRVADAADEHEQ